MDTFELPAGIEHGTPEGFAAGCRKEKTCPALHTHGMCCVYAQVRSQTDVRYYRAKARNPDPAAIAAALGIQPLYLEVVATEAAIDEEFAGKPETYRFKERKPRKPKSTPDAAQPLAERANDTDPQEDAGTPAIETEAPTIEPAAEAEAMGHPQPTPTPTPEETAMPTPKDIVKPRPKTTRKTTTTPKTTKAAAPQLTTEKWTAGLTRYAKTKVISQIRDWCRTNGYPDVPTHGRIPQDALAAYDAAHGEISIDIVADTTNLHEALADQVVVTALTPRPVPGGMLNAILRREAEASIALDKGDHDGQTYTVEEVVEEAKDEIAKHFDVPREVLDAPADLVKLDPIELAKQRAREWSERVVEVEEALTGLLPGAAKPLEPAEFDEALEQARERIAEQFEGAAPAPTEVLRGAQRRVDEHTVTAGAGPVLEPAGERPEWAEVAISVDVERARDLAARLEAELARTEAALATVIERWWAQVAENTRLRNEMDELVEYASLALIAEQAATRAVRNSNYAIAQLRRRENRKKGRR